MQWPQEALHASDHREFSESLETKYNSPKTFTFYSYSPQSYHNLILSTLTVSRVGLEPDTLSLHGDTWANESHVPGDAGIYQVVLGSQAVPSDLEMKVYIEDLTLNVNELARVWTEGRTQTYLRDRNFNVEQNCPSDDHNKGLLESRRQIRDLWISPMVRLSLLSYDEIRSALI